MAKNKQLNYKNFLGIILNNKEQYTSLILAFNFFYDKLLEYENKDGKPNNKGLPKEKRILIKKSNFYANLNEDLNVSHSNDEKFNSSESNSKVKPKQENEEETLILKVYD